VEEAPTMNRDAGIGLLRRTRLGWVRRSIRDLALLVAGSPGLSRSPDQAPLEHSIAHVVWAAVTPGHRHVLRHFLQQASHRRGEKE
jgi:hypothetical protein